MRLVNIIIRKTVLYSNAFSLQIIGRMLCNRIIMIMTLTRQGMIFVLFNLVVYIAISIND